MGRIIKLISGLFLLAALHNWDLFCGTQICRGMVDDMEVTYISRVALFGFIGLVMIIYEVYMYFAARKDNNNEIKVIADAN